MSKQVLFNQAVLEFHGPGSLPRGITRALDASGPGRTRNKPTKARRSRKKSNFCVEITRIGYGSKTFEISDATAEDAERIALEQAGNHEFTEKNSEYEVQSVSESIAGFKRKCSRRPGAF